MGAFIQKKMEENQNPKGLQELASLLRPSTPFADTTTLQVSKRNGWLMVYFLSVVIVRIAHESIW